MLTYAEIKKVFNALKVSINSLTYWRKNWTIDVQGIQQMVSDFGSKYTSVVESEPKNDKEIPSDYSVLIKSLKKITDEWKRMAGVYGLESWDTSYIEITKAVNSFDNLIFDHSVEDSKKLAKNNSDVKHTESKEAEQKDWKLEHDKVQAQYDALLKDNTTQQEKIMNLNLFKGLILDKCSTLIKHINASKEEMPKNIADIIQDLQPYVEDNQSILNAMAPKKTPVSTPSVVSGSLLKPNQRQAREFVPQTAPTHTVTFFMQAPSTAQAKQDEIVQKNDQQETYTV